MFPVSVSIIHLDTVGLAVGASVGDLVGFLVGDAVVGLSVGFCVGLTVGESVGFCVGSLTLTSIQNKFAGYCVHPGRSVEVAVQNLPSYGTSEPVPVPVGFDWIVKPALETGVTGGSKPAENDLEGTIPTQKAPVTVIKLNPKLAPETTFSPLTTDCTGQVPKVPEDGPSEAEFVLVITISKGPAKMSAQKRTSVIYLDPVFSKQVMTY